jgi:hypothetical protein
VNSHCLADRQNLGWIISPSPLHRV